MFHKCARGRQKDISMNSVLGPFLSSHPLSVQTTIEDTKSLTIKQMVDRVGKGIHDWDWKIQGFDSTSLPQGYWRPNVHQWSLLLQQWWSFAALWWYEELRLRLIVRHIWCTLRQKKKVGVSNGSLQAMQKQFVFRGDFGSWYCRAALFRNIFHWMRSSQL